MTEPSAEFLRLYGKHAAEVQAYLEHVDKDAAALAQSFAYGAIWSRPGLSLRDRSLVTVAALVALGRAKQVRVHLLGLLNLGETPSAIKEAVMQLIPYCGFPAVLDALEVLNGVSGSSKPQDRSP